MGKVYEFNNNDEQCDCSYCQLTNEFLLYVLDADSPDEVRDILRQLVSEASKLTLIDFLQKEIQNNAALLDHLVYGIDEETEH